MKIFFYIRCCMNHEICGSSYSNCISILGEIIPLSLILLMLLIAFLFNMIKKYKFNQS